MMHNKIQQYRRVHVSSCSLHRLNLITYLNSNKNTVFYGSCIDYKRGKLLPYAIFLLGSFLQWAALTTPNIEAEDCVF